MKQKKIKAKQYLCGVDIGATIVKAGIVNDKGKVLIKTSFYTQDIASQKDFIKAIFDSIDSLVRKLGIKQQAIKSIGIGAPGLVDFKKGIVHTLTNIKGWHEVPLRSIVQRRYKTNVYVDNDANSFANGQLIWGAAKGTNNAVCITLGSGVGGGLIIDGKLFRGSNFSAGEIGHMCIDMQGPNCNCGNNGCLEVFLGNRHIVRRAIWKIKNGSNTILKNMVNGKLEAITPELITRAAKKGDFFAINIWKETACYLAVGLTNLINIINPEVIVIGGGISNAGNFILNPLKQQLSKKTMQQPLKVLSVKFSLFADEAGIIGAASLGA